MIVPRLGHRVDDGGLRGREEPDRDGRPAPSRGQCRDHLVDVRTGPGIARSSGRQHHGILWPRAGFGQALLKHPNQHGVWAESFGRDGQTAGRLDSMGDIDPDMEPGRQQQRNDYNQAALSRVTLDDVVQRGFVDVNVSRADLDLGATLRDRQAEQSHRPAPGGQAGPMRAANQYRRTLSQWTRFHGVVVSMDGVSVNGGKPISALDHGLDDAAAAETGSQSGDRDLNGVQVGRPR